MQKQSSPSVRVIYPDRNRQDVIQTIRSHIPDLATHLPLLKVVLFGSYAHGRFTAASDIDLFVLYKGDARADAFATVRRRIPVARLEPHVYCRSEYTQVKQTLDKMLSGGITLYTDHPTTRTIPRP